MFYPILCKQSCIFDEVLTVSGAGAFTFDYEAPYLYVTDQGVTNNGVLKIYDCSDPTTPVLKSTTNLEAGSGPQHPLAVGNRLYIPYKASRKLAIWDVTDRTTPVLLGTCAVSYNSVPGTPQGPVAVAVIGNYACCPVGYGFMGAPGDDVDAVKIDVSNPASPTIVDTFKRDAVSHSNYYVKAYGNTFFISGQRGGSGAGFVVSVSASTFNELGMVTSSSSLVTIPKTDITPDGNWLYGVETSNSDIIIVDISNPSSMVRSEFTMVGPGFTGSAFQGIAACTDVERLYVGRGNGGGLAIYIMDITDRDSPVQTGTLSTSGETVNDMCQILGGCPGFVWGQGTGAAIHLVGDPPLS